VYSQWEATSALLILVYPQRVFEAKAHALEDDKVAAGLTHKCHSTARPSHLIPLCHPVPPQRALGMKAQSLEEVQVSRSPQGHPHRRTSLDSRMQPSQRLAAGRMNDLEETKVSAPVIARAVPWCANLTTRIPRGLQRMMEDAVQKLEEEKVSLRGLQWLPPKTDSSILVATPFLRTWQRPGPTAWRTRRWGQPVCVKL
jgi:hypothetical protein